MARQKNGRTAGAVQILYRRYYAGKPKRVQGLDDARANDSVARKLIDLRLRAGMTQRQLANLVGTTASAMPSAVDTINRTIHAKKKVVVVGTSTCRARESSVTSDGHLKPSKGWTDKFIFPPYDFKITDMLITNFHLPESTLLMLVSAFAGHDFMMRAYKKAIKDGYR